MTTPAASDPVPVVPYAAPPPPRPAFSWLAFFAGLFLTGCAAVVLVVVVPKFKEIFVDFHLRLPGATLLLLTLSDAARGWGSLAFLIIPLGLGLLAPRLTSRRLSADAPVTRRLNRLMALAIVLFFTLVLVIFTGVAVMAPMISLIEGISPNNNGPTARN